MLVAIALFFVLGVHKYVSFEQLQQHRESLSEFVDENLVTSLLLFALIYIGLTSLSIPSATALTLLAGAIFGFGLGVVVVSFASAIGASFAFLLSRYLFRQAVTNRFPKQLESINKGMEREGNFYLFAMRLIPPLPYFVINVAMGMTSIKLWSFYWVSQVGMIAGTLVFVAAGSQLSQVESVAGILSPPLLIALIAMGCLPLIAKWLVNFIQSKIDKR